MSNPKSRTKKNVARKAPKKSLSGLQKSHAKKFLSAVNALLASEGHGFAAKVQEIHLLPTGADDSSFGCGNCPPPRICKRVCFINSQGIPECENRCVDPS